MDNNIVSTVINRSDWIRLTSTMTEVKLVAMSIEDDPDTMALSIAGGQFKFPKSEAIKLCNIILEIASNKESKGEISE